MQCTERSQDRLQQVRPEPTFESFTVNFVQAGHGVVTKGLVVVSGHPRLVLWAESGEQG